MLKMIWKISRRKKWVRYGLLCDCDEEPCAEPVNRPADPCDDPPEDPKEAFAIPLLVREKKKRKKKHYFCCAM